MFSLGEYIELPSVVQIRYTLDIYGTTITCMLLLWLPPVCRSPSIYNTARLMGLKLNTYIERLHTDTVDALSQ